MLMVIAALTLILAGCATLQDVADEKNHGTVRMYSVPTEQAYDAAARVLRSSVSFASVEQDRPNGHLVASFNGGLGFLGVWVESVSTTESRVTVLLKSRTPFPSMTESGFHERMAAAVARR